MRSHECCCVFYQHIRICTYIKIKVVVVVVGVICGALVCHGYTV